MSHDRPDDLDTLLSRDSDDFDSYLPRFSEVLRNADAKKAEAWRRDALASPELQAAVADLRRLETDDSNRMQLVPLLSPEEVAKYHADRALQREAARAKAAEQEKAFLEARLPKRAVPPAKLAEAPIVVVEPTPMRRLAEGPGPEALTEELPRFIARSEARASEAASPAGVPAPFGQRFKAALYVGACFFVAGVVLALVLQLRGEADGVDGVDGVEAASETAAAASASEAAGAGSTAVPTAPAVATTASEVASAAPVASEAPSAATVASVAPPVAAASVKRVKPVAAPPTRDAGTIAPALSPDFAQ